MPHSLSYFYRGKRVLITGHTGLQGGWLAAWLKLLGAQVYGYALPPAGRPNFFDATMLDRGMTSIFADVRDRNSLATAFAEFQPELVFHCALRSNQAFSNREPLEAFSTNVIGTLNLLEEARMTGSPRAIVIANVGAIEHLKDFEAADAKLPPRLSDVSMMCAELASEAFAQSFLSRDRIAVATARSPEVIGGGDWGEGRLIPNLIRSLTSGEPVHVADDSNVTLCHVLELAHGYLLLGEALFERGQECAGQWSFSPSAECLVRAVEVSKILVRLWDTAESEIAPTGAQSQAVNSAGRAHTQLGWSQILSSDQALRWTVEWYHAFYADAASAWRTTDTQIQSYMNACSGRRAR